MVHPVAFCVSGLILLAVIGCSESSTARAARDEMSAGKAAISQHGCGSCHTIPGIPGADALVGPSLEHIASRTYIAGVLTNTPTNMARWIHDPPAVDEKTAMPKLGVKDDDLRTIVNYLYSLR
jgi:cytochrome c